MIYVAVILAALLLVGLIYRYDLYEKEPWYMIALAIALGAAGMWVVGYAEDWLIQRSDRTRSLQGQALIASVCEEAIKISAVLLISFLVRRHFNDPIDGLIYGANAGLGAAIHEAFFYLSLSPASVAVFGREAVRLVLHTMLGALGGFAIGKVRFRLPGWPISLVGWITASMTLHFLWDYYCGLPASEGSDMFRRRMIAVALMLAGLTLFGIAASRGSHWSRQHLDPGSRIRLWGWPFRTHETNDETSDES